MWTADGRVAIREAEINKTEDGLCRASVSRRDSGRPQKARSRRNGWPHVGLRHHLPFLSKPASPVGYRTPVFFALAPSSQSACSSAMRVGVSTSADVVLPRSGRSGPLRDPSRVCRSTIGIIWGGDTEINWLKIKGRKKKSLKIEFQNESFIYPRRTNKLRKIHVWK